jgi:UDP-glucose 4-epimerase
MRTVLVTGGAGFLGSHLVDRLLRTGVAVRVFDNLSTGSLENLQAAAERNSDESRTVDVLYRGHLELIIGDVRDRQLLRKALRNVKAVFHLAALPVSPLPNSPVGDVHAVNVEGTLNLLHGALTEGVWRVLLASCASVYGESNRGPVGEETTPRPSTLFAASKLAAETYGHAFHARHELDTVSLRYFNVYGPRQKGLPDGGVVPSMLDAVQQRRAFAERDPRSTVDLLYVDDAVTATLAAAWAPRASGRSINVGSGQPINVSDVTQIAASIIGTAPVAVQARDEDSVPGCIWAQTQLAQELLDFRANTSLIAGLARTVSARGTGEVRTHSAFAPAGLSE